MSESFLNGRVTLHPGNCLDVLATLEENSIDSVVTDPPYHLTSIVKRFGAENAAPAKSGKTGAYKRASAGFMGKVWDGGEIAFEPETWAAVMRVLKPGGHLLAFGAPKNFGFMQYAIAQAGFEVRDVLCWLFGSGFPKSHDVSKGIDRTAPRVGMFDVFAAHYGERRRAANLTHNAICAAGGFYAEYNHGGASVNWEKGHNVPTREQWGVLQPLLGLSNEWLPLIERVEAEREIVSTREKLESWEYEGNNVYQTNGDKQRVTLDITTGATDAAKQWQGWGTALKPAYEPIILARKPLSESTVAANVLKWGVGALNIDGCRVATDEDLNGGTYVGERREINGTSWQTEDRSGGQGAGFRRGIGDFKQPLGRWPANVLHDGSDEVVRGFPDAGGGFGKRGGNKSLTSYGFADGSMETVGYGDSGSAARFFYSAKADSDDRLGSKHPTVKPVDLIEYLEVLVTPPGGTILDPFAGTGTAGEAAFRRGFKAILIEREEEYCNDIRRRMALCLSGSDERARESIKARTKDKPVDHGPLFGAAMTAPPVEQSPISREPLQ